MTREDAQHLLDSFRYAVLNQHANTFNIASVRDAAKRRYDRDEAALLAALLPQEKTDAE